MADEVKMDIHLGKQMQAYVEALKDSLKQEQKDTFNSLILEVETLKQQGSIAASKKDIEPIQTRLTEIALQATELMNNQTKNQEVIDRFVNEYNKRESKGTQEKSFENEWSSTIATEMEKHKDDVMQMQGQKSGKIEFEMKATMTTSNAITGGGMNAYNPRQGIVPAQKTNMRDLLTTVYSKNGLFVTYRETNSLQSPGLQTEGSDKANLQYAFTAGTTTLKYIAGYATFTKQLLFNLDFLQSTLPRMLQRDFFKKENDYFYDTIALAATGNTTSAATVDAEEVVAMIANQLTADFEPSYALVHWKDWGRLLVTKPSDYSLPAGTIVNSEGRITIAGVPLIGASFADSDHVMIIDRDYVERVEGESLRVEFSYENNDNFQKNLVTARVECFEEVNLLRTDAVIYRDLGNSA